MRTEDIVTKAFSRSFLGYDMQEVDEFLDQVIDKIDRMEDERREMLIAMEYLLTKLEKTGMLDEARRKSDSAVSALASPERTPAKKNGKLRRVRPDTPRTPALEAMTAAEGEPVAEEMETGGSAPQIDAFIPELLDELSTVFPDSDIKRPGERGARGKAKADE